ncbi:hypothetical protein MHI18_13160 [Peribacillus sp. FSL H8-0477]|uniref:hypothetical protein n=1 Tax=Peribacillus sp. FSL H8-0477 TaxID=2921388 RepID=UPI0030F51291
MKQLTYASPLTTRKNNFSIQDYIERIKYVITKFSGEGTKTTEGILHIQYVEKGMKLGFIYSKIAIA